MELVEDREEDVDESWDLSLEKQWLLLPLLLLLFLLLLLSISPLLACVANDNEDALCWKAIEGHCCDDDDDDDDDNNDDDVLDDNG